MATVAVHQPVVFGGFRRGSLVRPDDLYVMGADAATTPWLAAAPLEIRRGKMPRRRFYGPVRQNQR